MPEPQAEIDAIQKARLAVAVYDPDDWADLHQVADEDCVERCPACVAGDLYGVLREVVGLTTTPEKSG